VAVGLSVVSEYNKSGYYKEARCTTIGIEHLDDRECQQCEIRHDFKYCITSTFPCVKVYVRYKIGYKGEPHNATVYTSGLTANQQECSYQICYESRSKNSEEVAKFVDKWEEHYNTSVECYYNPYDKDVVIENIKYSRGGVIAALVIPSLVLLIGLMLFVGSIAWKYWPSKREDETTLLAPATKTQYKTVPATPGK